MEWKMSVVWVPVSDWERAKRFYEEALGLSPRVCDDELGWAEYHSGHDEVSICIGRNENGEFPSGGTIVFQVLDLVGSKRELEQRGVAFDGMAEVPGVVRLANFRDPDGNRLQLAQLVY